MTLKESLKIFGLFFLLGFIAYSNSLNNPFLIDDHAFFKDKVHNVWRASSDVYFRPLAVILPTIGYWLFKLNVTGYHWMNLLLLAMAGWSIQKFCVDMLKLDRTVGFLAGALFIIHPINGVLINYVTASVFIVQVMLMLGAIYFLNKKFLSCVLYILASFCHETALFLPLYAFALNYFHNPSTKPLTKAKEAWHCIFWLFIVFAMLFVFRLFHSSLNGLLFDKLDTLSITTGQYVATWTMMISWYLSRLIWMQDIVLILTRQPAKTNIVFWSMAAVILSGVVIYLYKRIKNDPVKQTGLTWLLIALAPSLVACFFQPVFGMMIEPHWFIFGVVGFFILAGQWLGTNLKSLGGKILLVVIVFCAVLSTRWHNWVWGDEIRYSTFMLKHSPDYTGAHAFLAQANMDRGNFEESKKHFKQVYKLGFYKEKIHSDLAMMALKQGHWQEARQEYWQLLKDKPNSSELLINVGITYVQENKFNQAKLYFDKAKAIDPNSPLLFLNYFKMYQKMGDEAKAIQTLKDCLNVIPDQNNAMAELMQIYMTRKDTANIQWLAQHMLTYSRDPLIRQNAQTILQWLNNSKSIK